MSDVTTQQPARQNLHRFLQATAGVPQALLDAEEKRYAARQAIKAKRALRAANRAKRDVASAH